MNKKHKKSRFCLIDIYNFKLKHRLFAFFIFLCFVIFLYFRFLVIPVMVANTETQISSYATKSINYAIADSINQNVSYGELINIIRDQNNNVSFIEANAVRINLLSKTMSRVVLSNFLEFAKIPIKVALGSFSGIAMLSGIGPKIAFNVNPYAEVYCFFNSSFESAGINQTYHKLYMIIQININVVFPFRKVNVKSDAEVLLSEALIVGKIPEVYLNSGKLNEMLNLVPDRFSSWQKSIVDT